MTGLRTLSRRYRTAILLGLAAAVAFQLPPFQLASRVDGKVFDLWSRLLAPDAPTDIVVVSLDDAAWLTTLADMAKRERARLLIATLPQPPSPFVNEHALGPTELALTDQIVHRTEWRRGGHLWFGRHADGIVRQDATHLGDGDTIPSLAFAAATAYAELDVGATATTGTSAAQRWLRFFRPGSLDVVTPRELLAVPGRLTGSVVIAGRDLPSYATPVGALPAPELLAHAFGGYRDGIAINASLGGTLGAWALALAFLAALIARPRTLLRWRFAVPATGAVGALGVSAMAFLVASTWVPPAAPVALILVTGGMLATRPRRKALRHDSAARLEAARGALAAGDLDRAWWLYRGMPPTTALLDELYELGATLESNDCREQAADVYYRVALVDARFRDVAQRLVAATRPEGPAREPPPANGDAKLTALGRYEILAPIGRGSTGTVYLARDPKINRLLAIKVIDLTAEYEAQDLADGAERFAREAETAGRLNHANIVTVFDIGETQGLAYIAMEYLKGHHLSDFTKPGTLLPPAVVLELGAQTADALHYAHAQNVVHRDIKPANIMYDSVSGSLKITDFGIARLIDVSRTRTGIVLGTPSFMAPEQFEGRNVNGHTDLFALGVSLYELLTGRLPFRGASMTKLMFVITNEPHEPLTRARPDLPDQLDALIDTALAKDPANRFQTGAEMAAALRAIAAQTG